MKTNQYGYTVLVMLLAIEILIVCFFFAGDTSRIVQRLVIPSSIILVIYALFYKLKIVVDNATIRLAFGIGAIRKSIDIKTVEAVEIVKSSPLLGWGIRYHKDFTIYNIDGTDAIELTFKHTSRKVRIGTDTPVQLYSYILKSMKNCR